MFTSETAQEFLANTNASLAEKGELLLTAQVDTPEQAEEIIRWLYRPEESPMSARLVEVAWDKVAIDKKTSMALDALIEALST